MLVRLTSINIPITMHHTLKFDLKLSMNIFLSWHYFETMCENRKASSTYSTTFNWNVKYVVETFSVTSILLSTVISVLFAELLNISSPFDFSDRYRFAVWSCHGFFHRWCKIRDNSIFRREKLSRRQRRP